MRKNRKEILDVISAKKERLTALEGQSLGAISLIMNTVNDLDAANKEIETEVNEIEAMEKSLAETKDSLTKQHDNNMKIAERFRAFISVEMEDSDNS